MGAHDIQILTAAAGASLLAAAAYRDVATRTIPNAISVLLAAVGLISRALLGPTALVVSVVASVALFLVLLAAFARGMVGGGDVKLMAAVACGLSLPELYHFVFVTAMSGGVLAGAHLVLRHALKGYRAARPPAHGSLGLYRIFIAERWRIARRGPLPYGVAIACGGIATVGPRISW